MTQRDFRFGPAASCNGGAGQVGSARAARRPPVLLLRVRHRPLFRGSGALDFCMPQQELHGSQVAGATIDERRLGSSE